MNKLTAKVLFIISLIAITISCSDAIDVNNNETNTTNSSVTKKRTLEEAIQIAQSSVKLFDDDIQTRGADTEKEKRVDLNNIQVICNSLSTRSATGSNNDTLLYIINFENNEGFAVVSANEDADGLLMMIEEGSYSDEISEEIPGFKMLLNNAARYVGATGNNVLTRGGASLHANNPAYTYDTMFVSSVFPRLGKQKWGQVVPEGTLCPNGIAGCAPVALVEALSYFEQPKKMALTYSGADTDSIDINWRDIKKHLLSGENGESIALNTIYECSASDNAHQVLAKICRQAGEELMASYDEATETSEAGTGAFVQLIPQTMRRYGYTSSNQDFRANVISNYIDDNCIIIMSGQDANSSSHAWVVDGYKIYRVFRYDTYMNVFTHYDLKYHHINWGWNGKRNGYFKESVFSTTSAYDYDFNPAGNNEGSSYNFNQNTKFIPIKYENE